MIPVVLFAYARPVHLARVLGCLRENRVPLIYAFADGPKGAADAAAVEETRGLLRRINWSEVRLEERKKNMGLGRNVLDGVDFVAARHNAFIVWEDDLVCTPGTYAWLCAALAYYADDARVMSVTAWTHPRVTPPTIGSAPYFDARAECWVWGTWTRGWQGMTAQTALEKMSVASQRGVPSDAYGSDLSEMARAEERKNIWAVRWLYHHLACRGLCLRPPWSMVEHIGFDASATNAKIDPAWASQPLSDSPAIPAIWPEILEHPLCQTMWRAAYPPLRFKQLRRLAQWLRRMWSNRGRTVP